MTAGLPGRPSAAPKGTAGRFTRNIKGLPRLRASNGIENGWLLDELSEYKKENVCAGAGSG
jgi:hypothetical protein